MKIHIKPTKSTMLFGIGVCAASMLMFLPFKVEAASTSTITAINSMTVNGSYAIGGGTITTDDGTINCGSDCTETYTVGQTVVFRATPSAGKTFYGWLYGGGCQEGVTSLVCTKVITDNYGGTETQVAQWRSTSASFSIQKTGTGSGTVTGSGIQCGATCSATFNNNAAISLTAVPAAGSTFSGWQIGGLCANGGGKATSSVNTSPTCNFAFNTDGATLFAIAKFDSTSPSPAPTTVVPKTQPPASPTTPTTTTPETTPTNTSLAMQEITLNGQKFDGKTVPSFPKSTEVIVSGKTFPNATVKLFIFSTPRETTVKANVDGVWTYTARGLEPGDHRVEAEVTDPTTNKALERSVVARFSLVDTAASAAKTVNQFPLLQIAIACFVVLVGAAAGFIVHKRRSSNTTSGPQFPNT